MAEKQQSREPESLDGLAEAIENLTTLIKIEPDETKRLKLLKHQKKLIRQQKELIDKAIDTDTNEYKQAIAKLQEGNKALKDAIDDLAKVAAVINVLAQVVSAIAAVLSTIK
jgi:predicted translin family RNA/ssDNA-binding protein